MVIEKQISFFRFLILSQWEVEPAHGACVIILKPWLQAIRVEDMATGHEHALLSHLYIITAHSAKWRFKLTFYFLTMFLFNFDDRKSVYSFLFGLLARYLL